MLVFNPKRIFALRGIEKPNRFLIKNGISPPTVHKLLNGKTQHLKIGHLEKFCRLLNCTPSDLFEWQDDDAPIAENHALNTLQRKGRSRKLSEIMKDVPIERFGEMEEMLDNLKNRE